MATYFDLSHPKSMYSTHSACEPQSHRYDPVTEISPRIPRVPSANGIPINRISRQPAQGPPERSLPGLSELFASKLLVAPTTKRERGTTQRQSESSNQHGNSASPQSPSRHDSVLVGRRDSLAFTAERSSVTSSAPTTPTSWTSDLPPLQSVGHTLHPATGSPTFSPSESFGVGVVGSHGASWTSEHRAPRHGHGLPPNQHNGEVPVHRVDSRAGWRESDIRSAGPELLPATYIYRTDCGMISSSQPYPECAVGFSVPGRDDLVYPMWDLTKRKLPRKRMSTACTDCRKKKIRCEPGPGGCLQCRKAQKPCVIEPVKRRRRKRALPQESEESDQGSEDIDKLRSR